MWFVDIALCLVCYNKIPNNNVIQYYEDATPACVVAVLQTYNSKNYFARNRTTQAVVQAKKSNVHATNKRIFTVQHHFYFFDITVTRTVLIV